MAVSLSFGQDVCLNHFIEGGYGCRDEGNRKTTLLQWGEKIRNVSQACGPGATGYRGTSLAGTNGHTWSEDLRDWRTGRRCRGVFSMRPILRFDERRLLFRWIICICYLNGTYFSLKPKGRLWTQSEKTSLRYLRPIIEDDIVDFQFCPS